MEYQFDRYVGGKRMAEGATITGCASREEAEKKAFEIFTPGARPGEMARTEFVLINTETE